MEKIVTVSMVEVDYENIKRGLGDAVLETVRHLAKKIEDEGLFERLLTEVAAYNAFVDGCR